ncbi:ribosome recycling factor [Candidatus Saccharibacteria bacterium]|jgi:ribosome recycling factor|nr:ribosome recycling factor [Candidatus Saccharibacteria bacterium]
MFDTKPYQEKMNNAFAHYEDELKKVRTGRAHVSMLDGIQIEAYGSIMPLEQVAHVTAPEAQMLLVTPYDPSHITTITAAIRDSQSLGFNPSDDGRVVRVPVPTLTEERRKQMVKLASEKVEETRIVLRTIRQDAFKEIKRLKDNKDISEDDQKRIEQEIDKLMSDFQDRIDEAFKQKESDILTV